MRQEQKDELMQERREQRAGNSLEGFGGSLKEHIMYLDFPVFSVLQLVSHFSYQLADQSTYSFPLHDYEVTLT